MPKGQLLIPSLSCHEQRGLLVESLFCGNRKGELHTPQSRGHSLPWVNQPALLFKVRWSWCERTLHVNRVFFRHLNISGFDVRCRHYWMIQVCFVFLQWKMKMNLFLFFCSWLYEGVQRKNAEELLLLPENKVGSFLVRENMKERGSTEKKITF